jgi:hypothetical protein
MSLIILFTFTECPDRENPRIYGSLDLKTSSNYEKMKKAILISYELVAEAYRQKFRSCENRMIRLMLNLSPKQVEQI